MPTYTIGCTDPDCPWEDDMEFDNYADAAEHAAGRSCDICEDRGARVKH